MSILTKGSSRALKKLMYCNVTYPYLPNKSTAIQCCQMCKNCHYEKSYTHLTYNYSLINVVNFCWQNLPLTITKAVSRSKIKNFFLRSDSNLMVLIGHFWCWSYLYPIRFQRFQLMFRKNIYNQRPIACVLTFYINETAIHHS